MKLQKNTRLALYSVLEFAIDPTRHVSAAEIAAKYDVSPHHLAKVLSELARAGVVESVRGVGGGYRFAGNARRLTLMDVIRLFEELGTAERRSARAGGVHSGRAGSCQRAFGNRRDREGDDELDHARDDAAAARTATACTRDGVGRDTTSCESNTASPSPQVLTPL